MKSIDECTKDPIIMLFVVAVVAILLATFLPQEKNIIPSTSDHYCEMWKIWHDSDGEYGWPDQNNQYEIECKK
jgi:hypothetical protein